MAFPQGGKSVFLYFRISKYFHEFPSISVFQKYLEILKFPLRLSGKISSPHVCPFRHTCVRSSVSEKIAKPDIQPIFLGLKHFCSELTKLCSFSSRYLRSLENIRGRTTCIIFGYDNKTKKMKESKWISN